LGVAMFVAVFI